MRIRDKIITAACLTSDGIEWTTKKVRQNGESELEEQGNRKLAQDDGASGSISMESIQLPDDVCDKLAGDLTASIRTSELLMRTMVFPTADPAEIAGMVGFQMDKIAPYPLDQLAVSHEILEKTENGAYVLMVALRHQCIDAIGETFKHKGIYIHSIDARILGWLHLIGKAGHVKDDVCELLVVNDGIDLVLVVLSGGIPMAFRSLSKPRHDDDWIKELAEEVAYTLTMLGVDFDLPAPQGINIWGYEHFSPETIAKLSSHTGFKINQHSLAELPPLSVGIIERAIEKENRIELIPKEWVEYEKDKRLKKMFALSSAAIAAVWLIGLLSFVGVYQARAMALDKVLKEQADLKPKADMALENRKKLMALKSYSDRTDSAIECLREATLLLPTGDITFNSFNYTKSKGVTLRGTAASDEIVYGYWESLARSGLFGEITDQQVRKGRQTRGSEPRSEFSATLTLPIKDQI